MPIEFRVQSRQSFASGSVGEPFLATPDAVDPFIERDAGTEFLDRLM
jgi:hypothetical protein